jgi:PilZ domain-containing protein
MPLHVRVVGPAGAMRARVEGALRWGGLDPEEGAAAPAVIVRLEDAAHPPWPDVPTIVVSSKTDIDSFTNAITSGAAAYLVSPVDAAELTAAVHRLAQWKAPAPGSTTRKLSRRPLLLDVDLDIEGRHVRGHLVDVSAGGCRVETYGRVPRGCEVTLTPRALGTSTGIALGAVVTRTRRVETVQPPLCEAALRFNATSALLAGRIFGTPGAERRQALRAAE